MNHSSVQVPLRRGLTFTETIIAMSVMGILAAAALPKWSKALEAQRVRSAARAVESDLRTAMRLAAIRSVPVSFKITTGTAIVEFTPPISAGATGTSEKIDYAQSYPGVKFSKADFNQTAAGRIDMYQQLTTSDAASVLTTALVQVNSGSSSMDVNLIDNYAPTAVASTTPSTSIASVVTTASAATTAAASTTTSSSTSWITALINLLGG
ncbi:MAG: type II secretion system protein [Pirellulales bacterium]